MTFLHTLQIIPLSNSTTFSLCQHFQCTCPALLAFHCCHKCTQWSGSTVYSGFTVLPFVLWLDILAVYLGKVLLLRRFIHCKHSTNTTFFCVLISIAPLAFSECYNCSGCTVYSVLLYFLCTSTVFLLYVFAVYYWEKVLLLRGFCSIIHCSNFFQPVWQFFFPISNKIYRRFLLFADLGGMAPAVRRNEIKSAWPHKHA